MLPELALEEAERIYTGAGELRSQGSVGSAERAEAWADRLLRQFESDPRQPTTLTIPQADGGFLQAPALTAGTLASWLEGRSPALRDADIEPLLGSAAAQYAD